LLDKGVIYLVSADFVKRHRWQARNSVFWHFERSTMNGLGAVSDEKQWEMFG